MASTERQSEPSGHAAGAGQAPPVDALHPDVRVRGSRRSRSSCGARAATSTTSTATATSTGCRRCSASTSATAAPTSRRPAPTRPRSSASSPTGPTRTRRAIELAARIASLAPGDLNRVFFTSGGSEAVESALKLARQYHKLTGKPNKHKVIAREIAYHGTSLGALSATGITGLRQPFEPLTPGGCHVPNTNTYRLPPRHDRGRARRGDRRADRVRGPRHGRRRDPRAGPERRRLLHAARGLLPARPRDLRRVRRAADLRRGDLRLGPARRVVRRPALRLPARTSSPPPRA